MEAREHWNGVWTARAADQMSWYEAEPRLSLELIQATGVGPEDPIVDVGGGASLLVDRLLALGHRRLIVVDIAAASLERARERLGDRADKVSWITADVRELRLEAPVRLWHDRAVFHFLVDLPDQEAYLETMARSLEPGGYALLATFALDGPPKCSGLPVARQSGDTLAERLGSDFELVRTARQCHKTPSGVDQWFTYALFRHR